MSENELDLNYYTNEPPKPITHEMFNKLIKQRDQYKAENEKLKEELKTMELNQGEADDKIKKLERENEKYDKQFTGYIDETNVSLNLLSEFSQHIGNKPSSSTYKYFRAKLDNIGIKVDE